MEERGIQYYIDIIGQAKADEVIEGLKSQTFIIGGIGDTIYTFDTHPNQKELIYNAIRWNSLISRYGGGKPFLNWLEDTNLL